MDRDDRLALVPFDDAIAGQLLAHIDPDIREDHWHIVMSDGSDLSMGPGGIALLVELRPTRWIGRVLRLARADRPVGWGVVALDRLRPRLGRFVKDAPGPYRFP